MKLIQFLLYRPLREVVFGYVASTWGALEIVVTVCELVAVPILVPRIISIVILAGLALLLGVRMIVPIGAAPDALRLE